MARALSAIERNPEAEPQDVRRAGRLLARGLKDPRSQGYYRKVANEVNLGARRAREVIDAFDVTRRAMNEGGIDRPGALFAYRLRTTAVEWRGCAPAAAAAPPRPRSPEPLKPPRPPELAPGAPCKEIAATLRWFVGAGERATAAIVDGAAHSLRRAFGIHQNSRFRPGGDGEAARFVEYAGAICSSLAAGTLSWERVRDAFAQAQDDSRTGPGTCNSKRLGEALLERLWTRG